MDRLLVSCATGLLATLAIVPSWGQTSSLSDSTPSALSANKVSGQPLGSSRASAFQTPLYLDGRVLMDSGQPAPEPVSVELACGLSTLQVVRTDLKGNFQFVLGAGFHGDMDVSSMSEAPLGTDLNGGRSGLATDSGSIGNLTDCELRVFLDGYQPLVRHIISPPELQTIDAGLLRLTRLSGVEGNSISVTSMLVPDNARKEFEKGESDARNNKMKPAAEHLERAVAEYDHYAAAWTELGRIYASSRAVEQARRCFEEAIAADPKYVPPYVDFANLRLQNGEPEEAASTAGKALGLDPTDDLAQYIQAVAYFKLKRLDDAERGARIVASSSRRNMPQVHVLIADILLQRQDYSQAAGEMRAYLKQSPKGPLATEVERRLEDIERQTGTTATPNKTSSN